MCPILYMQHYSPPARAVLLTAEALGVKLECKIIDLSKKEHISEGFTKINPQHTIPTLDDDGIIIWDSHAINSYLVSKYGRNDDLYPKDLVKRALIDQRLHFDSGVVFSLLRQIVRGMKFKGRKSLSEDQIEEAIVAYDFLEKFLQPPNWAAGNHVTIADFSLISSISSLNVLYPIDANKYTNIVGWIKRAESLPYYESNRKGLEDFTITIKNLMSQ